MRIVSLCLAVLVCCCSGVRAQTQSNSLLWQISGKGLKQPSWIFGTFHIICKSDFEISPVLAAKVQAAKTVYGELKFDDPTMQLTLLKKLMMPDHSLDSLLGKDYEAVSKKFSEITGGGMSLKSFNHLKPFAVVAILAQASSKNCDQFQPDLEIQQIAKKAGSEVKGLETVEEQMDAIDKMPLEQQVRDLAKMILQYDSSILLNKQMIDLYKKRNPDSINAFIKKAGDISSEFDANLITNRNKKWIPLIEQASAAGTVFYAFGAGHLGGPNGVINLLRKRGYKLTAVKY